ncbi:response regulator [bacterium]|nr:response regulator [bacterium]
MMTSPDLYSSTHLDGRRVLLAEDNEVAQQQMLIVLRKLGADVDVSMDGREVLEQLQNEKYDLLILDIQLPPVHGIELVKEVRKTVSGGLKILGLTTMDYKGRALGAGMNAVLMRPVETVDLVSALLGLFEEDPAQGDRAAVAVNA